MSATQTLEDRMTKVEELTEHQNGDIAFIKEKAASTHERTFALEGKFDKGQRTLADIGMITSIMNDRLNIVDGRLGAVEVRLGNIEGDVGDLKTTVKGIDGHLGVIDGRLDVIETQVGEVHVLMTQVRNYFEDQRRAGENN